MQRLVQTIILMGLLSVTFGGCADSTNNNSPAVNSNGVNANAGAVRAAPTPSNTKDFEQVLSNASSSADDRVKAVDAYVADVETKLPSLTRKEKVLKPADLKGVTEASLEKLHAYYEGQSLKRIKTYPAGDSRKTEEFYFYNDKLIFVFVEPEGKGKEGHVPGAKGDRLYFDNNGLVAWADENGKRKDPAGSEFKTMSNKMVTEATAFRTLTQ
jgi:hypothetical protein